nr:unnamed protein product [Callosobruchus analis]
MTDLDIPGTLTPSEELQEPAKWGKLVALMSCLENVELLNDRFKVGRSNTCDVVIGHSIGETIIGSISKEHFLIIKEDNKVYLVDTSKNGTYKNGERIKKNEKTPLKNGDKIAIGSYSHNVFVFREASDDDLPPTASPNDDCIVQPMTIVTPWGRLIACLLGLDSVDLYQSTVSVGRSADCDFSVNDAKLDPKVKAIFSKKQFVIYRDCEKGVAFIKDLSTYGTYLNGVRIGKNNQNVLQRDDVIAVGKQDRKVFIYRSYSQEISYLPEELRGKYEPSIMLGKGAAGEVRLAFEKRTCEMFAIKKILKARSSTSQMCKLNHPLKIQSEINILQSLSHPFIIKMRDIIEMPEEVFIVLDYMKGGELKNRIQSRSPMTESNVKFLFHQIVLAVEYLHKQGITHRDLKPENVLLATEESETLVKVSDFGLSKITEEEDVMNTVCGTYYYMAPEVIGAHNPQYNKQVDVWSLGVILYYMLSGSLPFKSSDKKELNRLIVSGQYQMLDTCWHSVSKGVRDLVQRMLTVVPQKRITVAEILKHPWIDKDMAMKYKINTLLEANMVSSEEFLVTYNMDPPQKRLRLYSSEEPTM